MEDQRELERQMSIVKPEIWKQRLMKLEKEGGEKKMSAKNALRKLHKRQRAAKELSQNIKPRIWYLLAECLEKPYPCTLEGKYQFALQLLTK